MSKKEPASFALLGGKYQTGTILFRIFVFLLLFFALYLLYLIATPFLHVMILSIVVSGVAYPLYLWVLTFIKQRTVASFLVVVSMVICIILPITIIFIMLIPEAISITMKIQNYLLDSDSLSLFSPELEDSVRSIMEEYLPFLNFNEEQFKEDLLSLSKTTGQLLFTTATSAIKNVVYFLFQFFLFILIVFFLLRDGKAMLIRARELTPLPSESFERIMSSLRRVAKAVFVGGFMVAVIQACFASLGFWVIGYPGLLGGFATGLASLIPVIGTGLIWLPFSLYLFAVGETQSAFIFLAWCIIIVTNIDSFLRPYFMSGNVSASVLFIFLSILGGINVFGMLGIFYGPLILAFVLVMLDIYSEEYQAVLEKRDSME